MDAFKCIKPILPERATMVFAKIGEKSPTEGHLTFVGIEYDKNYGEAETGFYQTSSGDSGSPYWIEVLRQDGSQQQANAIIAVHKGEFNLLKPSAFYSDKKVYKCRSFASKVTPAIAKWIMDWHERVEVLKNPSA